MFLYAILRKYHFLNKAVAILQNMWYILFHIRIHTNRQTANYRKMSKYVKQISD
jgi:hypothetical protein